MILVLRSSEYFSPICRSSADMVFNIFLGLAKSSRISLIKSCFSLSSSSTAWRSSAASLESFISRIAAACKSENRNSFFKFILARAASLLLRITAITRSILSRAFLRPSKICSRSSAFLKSKAERRLTTSRRWSMNKESMDLRDKVSGTPRERATRLKLKLDSSWVFL